MTTIPRWERLQHLMETDGLDLTKHRCRVIGAWIWEEVRRSAPRGWETHVGQAVQHAATIYDDFTSEFDNSFLSDTGRGAAWVRRSLRERCGFTTAQHVEAVLNRIRDRRWILLHAFRRKYQASLFAPLTYVASMLRGYLRRVAWIESRKYPMAEFRQAAGRDPDQLEEQIRRDTLDSGGTDYGHRARQLTQFWSVANGFRPDYQLEGLVSVGLGWLADNPELAARSRLALEQKLSSWEPTNEHLRERIPALLDTRNELENDLNYAYDEAERNRLIDALARVNRRLDRARARVARHQDRLRPRPKEVQTLLADLVKPQVSTLHYQRIARELEIFRERFTRGARELTAPGRGCPETARLVGEVLAHDSATPPSPSAHGLDASERARRRTAYRVWLEEGSRLVAQVRQRMDELYRQAPTSVPQLDALLGWLADVLDHYELGILDRVGVIGGLRTRQGWRFDRLVRDVGIL